MLLLSNFIFIALLTVGVYSGLDKLLPLNLYLGILVCSEILNKFSDDISSDSKLVISLYSLFKQKIELKRIAKNLKTLFYFSSFLIWGAFFYEIICLATGHGLTTDDSVNSRLFCICTYIVLYFYSIFAIRTIEQDEEKKTLTPEAQWYRMLQYLAFYQFVFTSLYIAMYYLGEKVSDDYLLFTIHDLSIFALLTYLFCILCERFLDNYRILAAYVKDKKIKYEVPFFVSIIAANTSFKQSFIKSVQIISGVDLSKSEMASYITTHVEPVSIAALIIFWLLSSVVIIPPHQEGIFTRMGKIVGNQSYKSGPHFKLPWPFETVKFYEPQKVQTMNIGFKPDPNQRHIIWSKAHAAENFFLLVGNGVEIVAVDCQLFYKINDLYKFVTKVQNPETYIEDLAYRLLTASTVSENFDSIISQNRHTFVSDLRNKLQNELDKADLGVTAVEIVILAIHPPLEVTEAYEDVISAQIDKQMTILKANTETVHKLNMKLAFAINTENTAKGYAQTTVANAIGEAASFESRIIGYNTDPELERFRLKLDNIQKMMQKKNLYVIDNSFMEKSDRIMLNLQN